MRVDVSWLPPSEPPEGTCLVIDVLRATSTIAVLIERGMRSVYPAATIEGARALREQLGERALLCGEREALPPEGFDFGNSPVELARADLSAWDDAVITTSNGTPALLACAGAPLVIAAAPLNAAACVDAAVLEGHDVLIVPAGRRGERAQDDALAAGLFARRLVARGAEPTTRAREAIALLEASGDNLARAFRLTAHGRRLLELGFENDLEACAREDVLAAVPVLTSTELGPALRPLVRG